MPVTNYLTVNGQILGESGPNGTMYYDTDPLGSVTMTTDESANVLNEYRYKPYGALLSKTGTAPDPKFTWIGSRGYRATDRVHSDYYVRARHYSENEGEWSTVDLLWPHEQPYSYAASGPVTNIDPSGLCTQVLLQVSNECTVYKNGKLIGKRTIPGTKYYDGCKDCHQKKCWISTITAKITGEGAMHPSAKGCIPVHLLSAKGTCDGCGLIGKFLRTACDIAFSKVAAPFIDFVLDFEDSITCYKTWTPAMYVDCNMTATLTISNYVCVPVNQQCPCIQGGTG